jgi:uncharacterized membrane protein
MQIIAHLTQHLPRLVLLLTAGLASSAWAYPEYRVTIVGPPNSQATDINQRGVVIGNIYLNNDSPRAFLNRGAGVVYLGTLGGSASSAVAINDKGQVLVQWTTQGGQGRGYIYHAGTRRDIGTLAGASLRYTDINNAGFITAEGSAPGNWGPRGYLRSPDGKFTDIGNLVYDDPITLATAINNRNVVTGASGPLTFPDQPWRAISWTRGVMKDLGDFGWAPNYGEDINDCGQITGSMSVLGVFRDRIAFLYSNGRLRDIDGRPSGGERYSEGAGINGLGHVVGSSDHLSGFIYRGRRMQSLNALIDPALNWDIDSPRAINNAGQIAASATRKGVRYAVRLDLIRPTLEKVAAADADDGAVPEPGLDAAQAKADADAQAREQVLPVKQ